MSPVPDFWRHKKRNSVYELLGEARLMFHGELDNERMVVYRCVKTGQTYTRLHREFFDGRFERVSE